MSALLGLDCTLSRLYSVPFKRKHAGINDARLCRSECICIGTRYIYTHSPDAISCAFPQATHLYGVEKQQTMAVGQLLHGVRFFVCDLPLPNEHLSVRALSKPRQIRKLLLCRLRIRCGRLKWKSGGEGEQGQTRSGPMWLAKGNSATKDLFTPNDAPQNWRPRRHLAALKTLTALRELNQQRWKSQRCLQHRRQRRHKQTPEQ